MQSNLARFDLVSIRLALACAQTGSLTAAARDNHLALAAASRRLRELEETLGDPLFERRARGLVPTPAGQVFVRHALAMMQSLEQLGGELGDLHAGVMRHVRLCASTAAINQFLPPLLAQHAREHPKVRVDLEEQDSATVVRWLREGRADIGVLVQGPDVQGLQVHPFARDELVVVLPPRHRLRGRTPMPFADALDEEWISLNTGAALLQAQQQAAQAAGRRFRLRMQVRSFDTVGHLVAAGLGIALLPRGAAQAMVRAMGLQVRALSDAWARRELLVAVAAAQSDAVVLQLRDDLLAGCRPRLAANKTSRKTAAAAARKPR
ncbi:MAG: LysR family transcriptional regulator [Betaproteobacteria bacterium]|nr:LysR family transcriptional regulator [Betaproteobacteria bacterium]